MKDLIFNRVVQGIQENKKIRLSGEFTCIPFSLQRFSEVIPGIQKARYTIVTASSKVGKTQIADYLFVYEPYEFVTTTETNIKLKILYFSLEMSKESKIRQAVSYKLFKDTKRVLSPEQLDSLFKNYILEDEIEQKILSYEEFFEKFENTVTYFDNFRNPYGIFRAVREYAENNGKYIYKTLNIDGVDTQVVDYYQPNNPNEYVIVIVDHASLLTPEKEDDNDLRKAISRFSTKYCLPMRDRFKYHVVLIQQQASDVEKQQYTFRGDSIIQKVKPSPDGLGDSKTSQRDCDILLGLFAPIRYDIEEYNGYDITRFKNNYRELSILLNRNGGMRGIVDLYFNGAVNYFKELPREMNELNYIELGI